MSRRSAQAATGQEELNTVTDSPEDTIARSRDELRPSFTITDVPRKQRAQGTPGESAAPTAPCANKMHMSVVITGTKRSGVPRDGFTTYSTLSPDTE
jgi:hypothetical protein